MLMIGIAGLDGVGKSETAEHLRRMMEGLIPSRSIGVYDMSDLVREILDGVGVDLVQKTDEWRDACKRTVELFNEFEPNWILQTIRRSAEEGADDLVLVAGVRRKSESDWILADGGRLIWVSDGEEAPDWCRHAWVVPAPHRAGHAEELARLVQRIADGATCPA